MTPGNSSMSSRIAVFAYGVVSYAVFFATFLYAVGFVGNVVVPTTLDGPARGAVRAGARDRPRAARALRACSTA